MMKRTGTFGRLGMAAALALLLTGCLKLDMNLEIQSDDTVSGSVVFAVSKEMLELTGGSAEDLLGDTPFPSDIEGMTSEEYDDGEFAGQKFNFEGVPITQFSDPADPESLQITREGDTFSVVGALDLSQGLSGATGPIGGTGAQFLESAEIRIAVTFPGEVIEANGDIDGNTVVWTPEFGERLDIQATGSAVESGGSSSTLLYVLIGVGVVAVIAIVVAVMMGRRKKGPEAPPMDEGAAAPPMDAAAVPEASPGSAPAMPEAAPPAPEAIPPAASPSATGGTTSEPEPGPGGDAGEMPPPPPSQA